MKNVMAVISQGKVLKSNGTYQEISTIKKGDSVMNMYGKPVRVRNLIEKKNSSNIPILKLKHDNWFTTTTCSEYQQILTWDNRERVPKWVQADYFSSEEQPITLLPSRMDWSLPDNFNIETNFCTLQSSKELGFLFGAYMRIGYQKNVGTIGFHCDTSKQAVGLMVVECIKKLFNVDPQYRRGAFTYDIDFENDVLYNIFSDLMDKKLPDKYHCKNKDFIEGVNQGIMYSGHLGQLGVSNTNIYETLYWTSLCLGKPVNTGQLVRKYRGIPFLTSFGRLFKFDRIKIDSWTLDVDCETGSFIVDNLIVRND